MKLSKLRDWSPDLVSWEQRELWGGGAGVEND